MSDYGVFEASSTDGYEEDQRQRQATRDLGRAIEAAREGFGDFLGAATDKQDYKDRLALVMNDLMQKVADSGVMPVPGVMRKVKAALRPEFRKQAGKCPKCDGMGRETYEKENGSLSTQTCTECGGTGKVASRKQADVHWYDQNGRQEAHFAGGEHITIFPDGKWEVSTGAFLDSGQAPSVEQAKADALEALSYLAFGSRKSAGVYEDMLDFTGGHSGHVSFQDYKEFRENFLKDPLSEDEIAELKSKGVETTASRKTADDYVKGDALNFINHLQNGGYRMPKDAGYPGEGGQMDDELYDYTNGDQSRMSEITRFLQENWDYYAYGASRTAADTNLDDLQVLRFLYQFENEGLDSSASGNEQWEWAKSNIDYDTLQDAIDSAHEYGELGASQADALAYDLQQNFFGSRTAGAGDWSQTYDDSDEWKHNSNPQVVIMSEDDGFYLFNGIDLVEVTDTLEQAMDLGESTLRASSRKVASDDALLLDAMSDLMLKGNLSAEDEDAIRRAYTQGEQGKWEAAYNSVTFVADGPDLGSWEGDLVEAILDGIEALVGDPSRTVSSRRLAYTWRREDLDIGGELFELWKTAPEETAEAAVSGAVAEDLTGAGGFNWSVTDEYGEWIAHGNEPTVDAAKAAVERIL